MTSELYDALRASRRVMKVLKPLQIWRYDCLNDSTFMFEVRLSIEIHLRSDLLKICDNTWAHTIYSIDTGDFRCITYIDMAVPRLEKGPESSTPVAPTILGRTVQLDVAMSDFTFLPACDLQVLLESFVSE